MMMMMMMRVEEYERIGESERIWCHVSLALLESWWSMPENNLVSCNHDPPYPPPTFSP